MILVNRIAAYGTASSSLVDDSIPAGSLEQVILASQALRTQVPYTGGQIRRGRARGLSDYYPCLTLSLTVVESDRVCSASSGVEAGSPRTAIVAECSNGLGLS